MIFLSLGQGRPHLSGVLLLQLVLSASIHQPSPTMDSSSRPFRSFANCRPTSFGRSATGGVSTGKHSEGLPVADIFAVYETTMVDLLNRFLPTRQARVRRNPLSPWFDA